MNRSTRTTPEEDRRALIRLIHDSPWFTDLLQAAREVNAPNWCIGGGVLRDLVWDTQAGGFDPALVKDVDLAFFDPAHLGVDRDIEIEHALQASAPHIPWDAKNQAAVHTWYPQRFGIAVEPLVSVEDGVATWPETATSVAVRLTAGDAIEVIAPYGLQDLLGAVWRRNPRRVSVEEYELRIQRKQVRQRWPHVSIVPASHGSSATRLTEGASASRARTSPWGPCP
jgi:hypothetical protein